MTVVNVRAGYALSCVENFFCMFRLGLCGITADSRRKFESAKKRADEHVYLGFARDMVYFL